MNASFLTAETPLWLFLATGRCCRRGLPHLRAPGLERAEADAPGPVAQRRLTGRDRTESTSGGRRRSAS